MNGYFERVSDGTDTTDQHFIRAGSKVIAIHNRQSDYQHTLRYLHRDHLGSIDVVTDETGTVVARMSFDAFGRRRQSIDWNDGFPTSTEIEQIRNVTSRGYTGHQMIDATNLIHMNGRVYDPELGRFLSPDPNVPSPHNAQSYNRYSYVYNNPLSYSDPSGFVPYQEWSPVISRGWNFGTTGGTMEDYLMGSGSYGVGYVNGNVLRDRGVSENGHDTPRIWSEAIKESIAREVAQAKRFEEARKLDFEELMAMSPEERYDVLDRFAVRDSEAMLNSLDSSTMLADNQLGEIEKQRAYWQIAKATPYERMLGMKLGFGLAVDIAAIASDLGFIDMPDFFHSPEFGAVDIAGGVSSYYAAQSMVTYGAGSGVYGLAIVTAAGGGYAIGHGLNKMTGYRLSRLTADGLCWATGDC